MCENGCPYNEYQKFYKYYGSHTYADDWVTGALDGINVTYPTGRGGADFAVINDDDTRVEAIKGGAAYMNVWMYVIREFEDGIDDCMHGCALCNDSPVYSWDVGVAFYTGSLVQPQASLFTLACRDHASLNERATTGRPPWHQNKTSGVVSTRELLTTPFALLFPPALPSRMPGNALHSSPHLVRSGRPAADAPPPPLPFFPPPPLPLFPPPPLPTSSPSLLPTNPRLPAADG